MKKIIFMAIFMVIIILFLIAAYENVALAVAISLGILMTFFFI